jgi:MFS family permease
VSRARAGALAALTLVALDVAAVPAALPSARLDLGSSTSGLVWVQAAYLLALAVALLLLRHVGEPVHRRALVAAGLAAFAGGALLASAADDTATLVTGRALQGAGGAALLLPVLEILRAAGVEGRRALPLVTVGALAALAVAPLVGGAVAQEASWRWLFRLELAVAAPAVLLLGATARGAARVQPPVAADRLALALGLILAVAGLIQSGPWGWASADTLLLLTAGAALLAFAWRDGRTGADAAALVLAGSTSAALLVMPQYLELVRGLSPLRSGILTLAVTLPAATAAASARLLAGRVPPELALPGGLACATVGGLGMTRIDPGSSYAVVVVSLVLLGGGMGAAAGALATRGDAARSVAAAAPGAALVVAAAGALLQRAQTEEREAGASFEEALAAGVAASGWLLAALLAAAALLAWRRASSSSLWPGRTRQSASR